MRRFIFNKQGEAELYVTGAGVVYNTDNRPVGFVQEAQMVSPEGVHLGWFDDQFLWDEQGLLLGFVKGARADGGLELPQTRPLGFKPEPSPVALHPILLPREKPEPIWQWSEHSLALVGGPHYA